MAKIKQATKKSGRARKEQIVAELVEKLDSSNGLVFADYKGLTHKQLEDLKKELKKLDSTIVITKNSLIKLSLGKSQKYADYKDNEGLNLPTATLFIQGDMVEPLKRIQKIIKDLGLLKIKFGILEGNLTDEAGVLKIASLPNRETLLTQLVGTLNSPIQGLVFTLNANIQKFVMTLDAIAKNKPASQGQALEPE
jgi:large subunit ribosomal protein L10